MITYKLFRIKNGKLYPLYVEANREIEIGKWLQAGCGEKADETHVKSKLGALAFRPGFHSTKVPFTDWIGKRMPDGTLAQKPDTVWCECEVRGDELEVTSRSGLREIPNGWYFYRTNAKQVDPWIISGEIKVNRILDNEEVKNICAAHGIVAQSVA